ncbi:MAG: hypothetical protein Q8P89_03360, partial [bacterium]|nr:hypothetical protein [bacterium]
MWRFIITAFVVWRVSLLTTALVGSAFIPQRSGFLGLSVWANFDGVHYLSIAQNGYMRFQEAFFPLYPLLTGFLARSIFLGNYLWAGLFISHISFIIAIFIFYKLLSLDFSQKQTRLAIFGLLLFPTSLFFGSVYTESLFLVLILASFYMARREKWFWAGVLGGLASATKLVGIFLLPALFWEWYQDKIKNQRSKINPLNNPLWLSLIPVGLISYMVYLNNFVGDPLAFMHAQPAFGAQRTGGEIIFLPQVLWRYFKIFSTVPFTYYDFWIAFLEFFVFSVVVLTLIWFWKKEARRSYLIFSFLALIGPTLTGTFSSIPRYAGVLFPIFIFYGLIKNKRLVTFLYAGSFLLLL